MEQCRRLLRLDHGDSGAVVHSGVTLIRETNERGQFAEVLLDVVARKWLIHSALSRSARRGGKGEPTKRVGAMQIRRCSRSQASLVAPCNRQRSETRARTRRETSANRRCFLRSPRFSPSNCRRRLARSQTHSYCRSRIRYSDRISDQPRSPSWRRRQRRAPHERDLALGSLLRFGPGCLPGLAPRTSQLHAPKNRKERGGRFTVGVASAARCTRADSRGHPSADDNARTGATWSRAF